jgi:hypothetical protein
VSLKIFVSYSHADKHHRASLRTYLSTLEREGLVTTWVDQCISPGSDIDSSILEAIESADIVLLLLSQDFISSNYCYTRELGAALKLHEAGRCKVVPIVIRPCDWMSLSIGRLMALPGDAVPVTVWPNQDLAWLDVAQGLRTLVEQLIAARASSLSSPKGVREFIKEEFQRLTNKYAERLDTSLGARATGYEPLDLVVDGYQPGDLVLIAGRPEAGGESLLISSIVQNAIQRKLGVYVISPRATGATFSRKLMCNLGQIPHQHMVAANLIEEDWPRMTSALTLLADASVVIDDTPSFSRRDLVLRLENGVRNSSHQVVAIAALDYYSHSGVGDLTVSDFGRELKRIARQYGLVVLCSLSVDQGGSKAMQMPRLQDLDVWRSIEHDVDIIALMYGDTLYGEYVHQHSGEINVVKNPRGDSGAIEFTYFPDTFQFVDTQSG